MAPATIAGAALRARTGRGAEWDRDSIIIAIQEWVATYGEPPRAADWNPSSAKWAGQLWRVERYRAGRADGSAWPALNTAKRPFGGSLTTAVVAAGFEPAKPGPRRRSDVDPEQAQRALISPEGRAMLAAAIAQAREAERRVTVLEAKLERAGERALRLTAERDAARRAGRSAMPAGTPRIVRERVVDDAAVARAQRRAAAAEAKAAATVDGARGQIAEARMDAAEGRTAAKRMAAKLERAEATIATLRGERRELKLAGDRRADELVAAERLLERAHAQAERVPDVATAREQAPGAAEVRAARAAAARDRRAAAEAELRAARAERELRETVAAIRGEARKLTTAELAELRTRGPGGPAVMAEALRALAAARRTNNPMRMQDALRRVAQAAVMWQERI
jgi:chromosome segregation ATPase